MGAEPDHHSEVNEPAGFWQALPAEDRSPWWLKRRQPRWFWPRPHGRIEMVNRQAERMFGYERAELVNQPLEALMPARFHHGHVLLRRPFRGRLSSRLMGEGRDLFGLRKDGSEFPLEIGLNPIDLEGETMVLAGIVDITARRRIECEKEQQRLELARSNADLEEFAYVASHDLKAPLRAISHLVEWIAEDIEVTASTETIDNLKLLRGRVVRLQSLLDGLLAYARIGKARVSYEPSTLIRLCATSWRCCRRRRIRGRLRRHPANAAHPSHANSGRAAEPDCQWD